MLKSVRNQNKNKIAGKRNLTRDEYIEKKKQPKTEA